MRFLGSLDSSRNVATESRLALVTQQLVQLARQTDGNPRNRLERWPDWRLDPGIAAGSPVLDRPKAAGETCCSVGDRVLRMPILGLGLHVMVAILFAVHALRTDQERYWLFVLFLFPLLGSFVYALLVWLPEASRTRSGRRVVRGLRETLNPGRELREALAGFEHSATIANRIRVADALHGAGRFADAVAAYREALRGVHRDDADIQVKLARALLDGGDAMAARELLESLITRRPDFRSPEGHLVYARAVAATGDRDKAREEFQTLIGYFAGIEPRARYVDILRGWGETEAANRLVEESLHHIRHMPAGARRLNEDWIHHLRQASAGLARPS